MEFEVHCRYCGDVDNDRRICRLCRKPLRFGLLVGLGVGVLGGYVAPSTFLDFLLALL